MEINESFIRDNINLNELGLIFLEYEYNTDVGHIDILCKDDDGDLVPIEVKLGEAGNSAIGQILGYMKAINAERGVIIAQDFSDRIKLIAGDLNIDLVKYELNVEMEYFNENKIDLNKNPLICNNCININKKCSTFDQIMMALEHNNEDPDYCPHYEPKKKQDSLFDF